MAAGAIIAATGKERFSELAGIGRKMPITMAAFTAGSFSLVGIPLFSGFVGKWHLLLGSLEAGNWLAAAVIIAGSVLCGAYLFPILRIAYEPAPQPTDGRHAAKRQWSCWQRWWSSWAWHRVVSELAGRAAVDFLAIR